MTALRIIMVVVVYWSAAACGEDDAPPAKPAGATPATPTGGGGVPGTGAGSGKQLQPQTTIEERVVCLVETKADKTCDPKNPKCKIGDYCITNTDGSFCGPCKERDSIRHTFKARDFVATIDTRDPFQSFIVPQVGLGAGSDDKIAIDPTKNCVREDQMVAANYSWQDLKLVGIVTQGTQRKVLMLDSTSLGYIIKRGDCVGKEKAVVKEIGKEFITFELQQEANAQGVKRDPEQRSVLLYPKQLPVSSLPSDQQNQKTTITPVVAPPPQLPGKTPERPASSNTRIQVVPPTPAQPPVVPPQAPTTLKP